MLNIRRSCSHNAATPSSLLFSLFIFSMPDTLIPEQLLPDSFTRLAYQAFQQGKQTFGLAHKTLLSRVRSVVSPIEPGSTQSLSPQTLSLMKQRMDDLLEQDWHDAEAGVYPTSLLFDNPWGDFFAYYPLVVLDTPNAWNRYKSGRHQEFEDDIDTSRYPSYYVQNFHHQTNGYLSEMSANLYDLQVELLFNGTADAMRRRILAPIKRYLDTLATAEQPPKALDVACGTGRTLKMMRDAFPQLSLYGVDLSPTYLRKANQLLSQEAGMLPQLIQANVETLPYLDNYFDLTVSVFLFHELPGAVRQTVIDECYRVTRPGGLFVVCDSIQAVDSPELQPMMANFPKLFHEPYYRHYMDDDITARFAQAGFTVVEEYSHFMSKYWVARKA